MKNIAVILCLSLLFVTSCSEKQESSTRRPETEKVQVLLPVAESFGENTGNFSNVDRPVTRTLILGDGNLDKAAWAETDQISLWAVPQGGSDYILNAETFKYYTPLQGNALFTGTIAEMTPGTYNYYGAYPVSNAIDGTRVSYTLPTEQRGVYDGSLDIMLARPATGSELTAETPASAAQLSFAHKCHVLRIQVPTGRNKWGVGIKKLRIKFPAEVVGDLQFEVTNPDADPVFTNGSNTITLNLVRPLDESEEDASDGNYVWVFVRPGVQLTGQISFNAYDADNFRSYTISTNIDKLLAPGRITPLNLTIPQKQIVRLDMSIATNNLGEEVTDMELTAPTGFTFTDGTTTKSLKPVEGRFPTVETFYKEGLEKTNFTASYESESALLTGKSIGFPSTLSETAANAIPLTIPYLLEENFSKVSGDESQADENGSSASWLNDTGLIGWSGSRWKTAANTSLEIRTYIGSNTFVGDWDNKYARVDTAPLPLKAGKTVKISTTYKIGSTTNANNGKPVCIFGTTTEQGAIAGGYALKNKKTPTTVESFQPSTGGTPTNLPDTKSNQISGCTNSMRLTWFADYIRNSGTITGKTFYLYIDDIQVKIVK